MASARLEEHVAALEVEATKLRRQLKARDTITPWWEQMAGTFQHDPRYARTKRSRTNIANRFGRSRLRHVSGKMPDDRRSVPIIRLDRRRLHDEVADTVMDYL